MTSGQYRAACIKLGITVYESAEVLGISRTQAYRYANGHTPIPQMMAMLLRCMIKLGTIEV